MSNIIEDTNLGNKQIFAENFNYYLEKTGQNMPGIIFIILR